jgi:1-acyl-sn-glycerol-3-phosphate acyltransferase
MSDQKLALKPQVYLDERPAEYFQQFHAWARSHGADAMQDVVRLIVVPWCMFFYRARAAGAPQVPASGPAIIAPNHFSALDHFFVAMYLRRRVRFMAKSQLFRGPLGPILTHAGAFPVRRGHHDEQAMATALGILERGGVVVLYPEGGRSRTGEIAAHARPGVGRLALQSGAPVVPVAIQGSERARNWKRLQFPQVTVRYGAPRCYELSPGDRVPSHEREQAIADEILGAVRQLWGGQERLRPSRPRTSRAGIAISRRF